MSTYVHRGADGSEKGKYEGNKLTVNRDNGLVEILGGYNVTVVVIHLVPGEVVHMAAEKEA